jgi:hypothetical protein
MVGDEMGFARAQGILRAENGNGVDIVRIGHERHTGSSQADKSKYQIARNGHSRHSFIIVR